MIDAPCAIEDVFPTLCNAGGADASCNYGQDLAPLLAGERQQRDLFWHYPHSWGAKGPGISMTSAVRSGEWKLVWFWDRAECELYDLSKDLSEQRNLASIQPEMATALRNKLRAFLLESRAMLPVRKDGTAIAMP